MSSPLNGPLEVAVRVLTLLAEAFPRSLGLNQLVLLDHGLLHSEDLGGPSSLHPPVPIRSSELGVKRGQLTLGLEVLTRVGLAEICVVRDGIDFIAAEGAHPFLSLLETPYARGLSERARWVINRFGDLSDADLRAAIRDVSGRWAEEFENLPAEERLG
ncbi:threonine transporter [Cellulomonas sp. Sa3CUA2]|uniref:Threonine transporter n=1 Tax=Cellulomonas avistercoris TaxID=2762242 RepID=A0ABR8QHJ7_9CELL|nr:ABC-three component system middle component 2 [Cellulomonas avistercoris]MBD7919903.1 threonine transporter [Cellulomonas avistercoris]